MTKIPDAVAAYLQLLTPERRNALMALRAEILANIDARFEEGMQYGMPSWFLPHSQYPPGYHCNPKEPLPYLSLASQKNHIGIYLFCIYCDEEEKEKFVSEWKETGCRLDMGKACIRVRRLEEIPLSVIGGALRRISAETFIAAYEAGIPANAKRKRIRGRS